MKARFILFALSLALVACSPERRLQRLIAKHPELVQKDTITIHDTIILPGDTVTATRWLMARDTVTIETERQVVRVVRIPTGSPCDTALFLANIEGIVKPDTVFRTIEVPVEKLVPCPPGKVQWWVWVIVGLSLLIALVQTLRR